MLMILLVAAVIAGGVASVVGFGIGSILTPVLSLEVSIKVAVAAVAIPHVVGTGQRLWSLRHHVDRRVFLPFGTASAAGGLVGALLHGWTGGSALTILFAILLMLAGLAELFGWNRRIRFRGLVSIGAGAVSGLLGGMVGNQGGIRSAALLGFELPRESFVATATAIALAVDAARLPVYLWIHGGKMLEHWPMIAWMTAGIVVGTYAGRYVLGQLPEGLFRRIVGVAVVALSLWMLYRAWNP